MLVDDNGDAQTDEQVVELCTSSFLKRPGTESFAVDHISRFMNNVVLARRIPAHDFSYHAAAFFLVKDKANWWLSGDAAVMLFADGKPSHVSEAKQYPFLGSNPGYRYETSDDFTLEKGSAALFLCAGARPDPDEVARLLTESDDPDQWMDRIVQTFGEQLSCAMTAFLPPPKSGLFQRQSKPHANGGVR